AHGCATARFTQPTAPIAKPKKEVRCARSPRVAATLPTNQSSGESNVLPGMALNSQNLVAKVLPIAISSATMVKEKGRLSGIGIFELHEQFSYLDSLRAMCALF